MSNYDNTNSGALFKNDKQGNDSRPDYRGPINVAGVDMEISAWLKTSKTGVKFMSLSIGPKWEKKDSGSAPSQQANAQPDFDDDLPFN